MKYFQVKDTYLYFSTTNTCFLFLLKLDKLLPPLCSKFIKKVLVVSKCISSISYPFIRYKLGPFRSSPS